MPDFYLAECALDWEMHSQQSYLMQDLDLEEEKPLIPKFDLESCVLTGTVVPFCPMDLQVKLGALAFSSDPNGSSNIREKAIVFIALNLIVFGIFIPFCSTLVPSLACSILSVVLILIDRKLSQVFSQHGI